VNNFYHLFAGRSSKLLITPFTSTPSMFDQAPSHSQSSEACLNDSGALSERLQTQFMLSLVGLVCSDERLQRLGAAATHLIVSGLLVIPVDTIQ